MLHFSLSFTKLSIQINLFMIFLYLFYEYHYIFEIQKCCGYTEWISVYKKDTITQLYNNLNIQFATNNKTTYKLYLINNEGNKILVENNNMNLTE